jgi:outer membrane protein
VSHRRTQLMLLALVVALAALGLVTGARAADLMDVWSRARASDPVLAGVDARRGVQREAAAQAGAALLPQWTLRAEHTRADHGRGAAHGVASSISQVLVDLGRLRTHDAERTFANASDARVAAAEQDLAARTARAYFGVLLAQAQLATTQANEAAFAMLAQQSQDRYANGLAAQVDVEQARSYHALAQGSTVRARQVLADARQALVELAGADPGALAPLVAELPALPPEPADPQAWVQQAERAHPLLRALALEVNGFDQRIGAARAQHAPTLSAGLDHQRLGGPGSAPADRDRTHALIGVRLSVPLFAGGAIDSAVRQAAHRRDQATHDAEAARRAVAREVHAQHEAVAAGARLLDSTRQAVAAADRALASMRAGQALGTRSTTDVLLAIQNQAAAQSAHDQARHGMVLARLLLQHAAGTLGPAELAHVNRLLVAP